MPDNPPLFKVTWLDEIDSTNAYLKRCLAAEPPPAPGKIIATMNQTAGRGRAGRSWHAPPGRTLCFSLFLEAGVPPSAVPSLMPATALAVDDALRSLGVPSYPKWPNDVMAKEAKISGILAENTVRGIILGIGINILLTIADTERIDRPATSILITTGKSPAPEMVLERVLNHLAKRLQTWMLKGFAGLQGEWSGRVRGIGSKVAIEENGRILHGILAGFGPRGELLLDTGEESPHRIWAGDLVHTLPHNRGG